MDREQLRKTVVFRGMNDEELSAALFALRSSVKEYAKDELILHAGNTTDMMGLVLKGSVRIESNDMWGNRAILSHVGAGQYFAETYALLPDEPMLVDVRANEDSRILFLYVGSLFESSFSVSWKERILKNLLLISSHKNLVLSGRSFHTSPKSCRGRLLSYLNTISMQKHSLVTALLLTGILFMQLQILLTTLQIQTVLLLLTVMP